MDSHIDNNGAFFYIFPRYHSGFADSGYQDIRPSGHFTQIFRFGMRYGNRTVFPQQQKGHRFADDIASSDNDTFFAGNLNAGTLQKLYDTRRRASYAEM